MQDCPIAAETLPSACDPTRAAPYRAHPTPKPWSYSGSDWLYSCEPCPHHPIVFGRCEGLQCRYYETTRRYAYTTPKSYLELISLYYSLLAKQRAELAENKTRLENGVEKIAQASRQVADLQVSTEWAQLCTGRLYRGQMCPESNCLSDHVYR